jgi:hypothetical protein
MADRWLFYNSLACLGRLEFQAYYRYDRQGDYPREAAALLNRADARAAKGYQDALSKMKP